MSCQKQTNAVAVSAAQTGLPALNNKLTQVVGSLNCRINTVSQQTGQVLNNLAARVDQGIDRVGRVQGPLAAAILDLPIRAADPQRRGAIRQIAAAAGGVGTGMYLKDQPAGVHRLVNTAVTGSVTLALALIPPARTAFKVLKLTEQASRQVGHIAGALSKTENAGQVIQEKRVLFFFKSRAPVALWKSSLTGLLNRADVVGTSRFSGRNMTASAGLMFTVKGQTWHCGTTTIRMSRGERTITHLQSLSLPNTHYYFDRPLADEQAVGLAVGQARPEAVPGFSGQVSATEGLFPAWAAGKRALILSRLHWPPQDKGHGL